MTASLSSLALILFVAAITPGPNNFIVLGLSLTRGWRDAFLAIYAIVAGTLLALALTALGFGLLLSEFPKVRQVLLGAGCLYLALQGIKMMTGRAVSSAPSTKVTPVLSLIVFQLINPKSWILVSTCYAATLPAVDAHLWGSPLLTASSLIILITSPCLITWAVAGHLLTSKLSTHITRTYVTPLLGAALLLSSISLVALS